MPVSRLDLPGMTPPSLNRVAGKRWEWARAKRDWQTSIEGLLMAEGLPRPVGYVNATAVLVFPTERRRDEGNFRALLEKALGDALVNGGWLRDDTPEQYAFGEVVFDRGDTRTVLTLDWGPR